MRLRVSTILACALLCLAPIASWADLAPYSQDFEGLLLSEDDQPAQTALANDGWLGFVNVWGPGFYYNYGPFPAPNGGFFGPAISAVVPDQGGPEQGDKQLDVFSDYANGNHRDGTNALIETNVFQEQVIGAADVGSTWIFEWDAKRGNIEGNVTAAAWFKLIGSGFQYIPVDMTSIPDTWGRYSLSIYIDPSLEGDLLQFGFLNQASNDQGSGIFYDNVNFFPKASLDIKPGSCPNPINRKSQGVVPAALLGTGNIDVNDVDVASLQLEGVAPIRWDYEDVAAPFGGDLCGCSQSGPDGFLDLTLKFRTQDLVAAIGPAQTGDLALTLTGTMLDGTPIEGGDCVIIVGLGGIRSTPIVDRERNRALPGSRGKPGRPDVDRIQPRKDGQQR